MNHEGTRGERRFRMTLKSRHRHGSCGHHDMREETGDGPDSGLDRRGGRHSGPERGRHGAGGGSQGPHGRARRGEARYILLDTLRSGPKHGYEIIKSIEERTGGQYSPSPGTVYPTMQYLGELGLVRTEIVGERRVFHLNPEGAEDIEAHTAEIADFWERFSTPTGSRSLQREAEFLRHELDDLARTVFGSRSTGPTGAGNTDVLREIRAAVEKCKNDVRDILARTPSDDMEAS